MTSVCNGKIRIWYMSKSASSNCGNERYISFTESKPTIYEQGQEWIPVISLDDFHKEVNINITRWVEVCNELSNERKKNKKLEGLILYTDELLCHEQCGGDIQLKQWIEYERFKNELINPQLKAVTLGEN